MSDWRITPLGDGSFRLSPFNGDGGEGGEGILPWVVLFVLGLFAFDMETQAGWFVGYIVVICMVCAKSPLLGWLLALVVFACNAYRACHG